MNDDQSVHSLLGPYVVDAVTEDERRAFERHLGSCADCRTEVASLQEVTATLAVAEAVEPPASLRARVMAQVATTPQLTPGEGAHADRIMRPRRASRLRRWVPLSAVAASILTVVAVGVGLLRPAPVPGETSAMERDVMMIVSAPDAHSMDLDLGTTHVVVSERMEGVAVMCADTPMPEDGMEYQLWLVMDDGSTMAGPTFMPDDSGEVMTMMHASLEDVSEIAITEEPKGGSEEPTSETLASVGM